ncbi:hypothetical protein [Streptomyces europaeiscabiei]|nr:hypothetical protein OHB30_19115 [Streptomyces europaeiscabiei]
MYGILSVDDPDHPELDGATVLVLNQAEGSLDPDSEVGTLPRSAPREST